MNKKEIGILLFTSICFLIIASVILNNKRNLAEDEVFSYGSANHQGSQFMQVEDGVTYEQGETPFEDYVYVQEDGRFQYRNVWKNQSKDIHPPVYYVLLHTVCSLFPETFSIWYAGIINVIFAVATLWIIYAILNEFDTDRKAAMIICIAFGLTAGIYQACTFFRMYVVAMFFCTLLCWLHIRWYKKDYQGKEWLFIYVASVGGVLTHYFVIVYVVLEAVMLGIILLSEKKYRILCRYAAAMCAAAVTSIALYPSMLVHIFARQRGEEAVKNAKNMTDLWARWKASGISVSHDVYGGFLWLVVLAAVCFCICWYKKTRKNNGKIKMWLLLLVPAVVYVLIISKISAYVSSRYISPAYGILLVAGYLLVWSTVNALISSPKKKIVFGIIGLLMVGNGFRICRWQFSYQDGGSMQALEMAKEYGDRNCLYIYKEGDIWAVQSSYFEIREYQSVTFFEDESLGRLAEKSELADEEGMILYVEKACDTEQVLNTVQEMYPQYSGIEKIAEAVYTSTYLLE